MGKPTGSYRAGDICFFHGKGSISVAIRWAEWIRWRNGCHWNHVGVLDVDSTGEWIVIAAGPKGVAADGRLEGDFAVVDPPPETNRVDLVNFMRWQIGRSYGFLTIASILATIVVPFRWFNVMLPNTWVCSAVAGEGLRYAGWYHSWPDIYQVSPAELWEGIA